MNRQLKQFIKPNKMNSVKTQDTWLPLFTGFYNSIFDCGDMYVEYETSLDNQEYQDYYSDLHSKGIDQEYFNKNMWDYLDFQEGNNGAAEYICNAILDVDSAGIILDVEYEKVCSPKYYNFSTDSINCKIKYDLKKLKKYLVEYRDEFETFITDTYTSCDGFSSSYSNDLGYWMDESNYSEHEIGSLLQFVLLNQSKDAVMNLYYESNLYEGFSNSVTLDQDKMISDFKTQKAV